MKIELEPLHDGEGYVARLTGDGLSPGRGVIVEDTWEKLIDVLADHLKSIAPL